MISLFAKRFAPGFIFLVHLASPSLSANLPNGFIHLKSVAPTIVQDMRYATKENFIGKVLDGYLAGECILASPVAKALAHVQAELNSSGHTLVVFDCYRPDRAVKMMVRTLQRRHEPHPKYYPRIDGKDLVTYGYVASRSGHSTGGSIDLTVAKVSGDRYQKADMGTIFDFFDPKSHTKTGKVTAEQKRNRSRLQLLMRRHGFSGYANEWWHFRYVNEPFKGRIFNFPVTSSK